MAILKSRKKGEYKRQIMIAQSMLDMCKRFGVNYQSTRASDIVIDFKSDVKAWADAYDVFLNK
jgi:hypothetical protein